MKKRKLFLCLLVLVCCICALYVCADAASYSGACGENATWSLNTETGLLTISGAGDMADYDNASDVPWYSYIHTIQTITISDGITSIGIHAFWDCSSLVSVTIPESVTSIGIEAFGRCSSLVSVTIPDSVTSIGWGAFFGCESLQEITVSADNPAYVSDAYGVLFNKDKTELICYPISCAQTEYSIPEGVERIGWGAFEGCLSLASITIPEGVKCIGDWAFEGCGLLTSVTIPSGATDIGWGAFYGCSSLTSVTIPESVTNIRPWAFEYCHNLTIYGYADSYAETYAEENDIPFVALTTYMLGDVNDDGTIDVLDAVAVLRYCADLQTGTFKTEAADTDKNGIVHVNDAVCILKYCADLITGF